MSASFPLTIPFLGSWQGQPRSAGDNVTSIWLPSISPSSEHILSSKEAGAAFPLLPLWSHSGPHFHMSVLKQPRNCSVLCRLLLQLDEFIYSALKCRTYLNSTASWCSSQFLSVSYCSLVLPNPEQDCPGSGLASCTMELIWLKNNPANSKMINSQGWITSCSPNAVSVTQSHGHVEADIMLTQLLVLDGGTEVTGACKAAPEWCPSGGPEWVILRNDLFFPTKSLLVQKSSKVTRHLVTTNATGWVHFRSGTAGWFSHSHGSDRISTADTDSSSSFQLCFVERCLFSTTYTGADRRMRSVSKISGPDATARFSMVTSITLKFGPTCLFTVQTNKYGLNSIPKGAISLTEAIQNCHIYRWTKEVQEWANPLFILCDTVSFLLLFSPPLFQLICT